MRRQKIVTVSMRCRWENEKIAFFFIETNNMSHGFIRVREKSYIANFNVVSARTNDFV